MIPGEYILAQAPIEMNVDRETLTVAVINHGDRPIQVGSHYHFYETNPALNFDREATLGMRLNIAAGTAVRFEPGQTRHVELVAVAGMRRIYGFRGAVMGALPAEPPVAKGSASKPSVSKQSEGEGGAHNG